MVRLGGNKVVQYKTQNYNDLKKHHLEQGTQFIDATFPAIDGVIGTSSIPPNIVWKRPKDICENPRLFENVETPLAIHPGELSCGWVVSAVSVLSGLNEIRNKVVPDYWEQEWDDKTYAGIFHFKFWRFGSWVDVVIDDFLPTVDNVLLTTQSSSKNEFWVPLLEKAYVKLHGSYDALREGQLSDALVDFTGGVCETIDLTAGRYVDIEDKRAQLFDLLYKENIDHSIICFSVTAPGGSGSERTELGLMRGHSYHMTDIKKAYLGETTLRSLFNGREKVAMLRFRDSREEEKKPPGSPDSALSEGNPFAFSTDVLSRLRSKNSDWQQIKDSERQRIGLNFRDPREFWMPIEDVVSEFNEVSLCRLVTENVFISTGKKWRGASITGKWIDGPRDSSMDRSGGGDSSQETFLHNPQYLFDIDSDTEVIFQLLQFVEEEARTPSVRVHLLMGFHIIKVEENRETRLHKLWDHTPIVITDDHKRTREMMYRGTMSKGRYIFVPTLYKPGDESSYQVRALSQTSQINFKELKVDVPKSMNPCMCFMPDIEWVTVLIVENAEIRSSTPQTWMSSKINPFCIISCEGKTVKTEIARDDTHPEWNSAYVFYRKKPDKPISLKELNRNLEVFLKDGKRTEFRPSGKLQVPVQFLTGQQQLRSYLVLNKNSLMPNELIGECQIPAPITHSPTPLDAPISRKAKASDENSDTISSGTVHLTILTEDNLMAV